MANSMKLPLFNGLGNDDLDQFSLVIKAIWEAQGITNDHMKKVTLVSALQDRTLTWYIKYSNDNPNVGLEKIHTTLNKEFGRAKYEAQLIMGFKEITMKPSETPWELDQRLKHYKWFMASLLPHLRLTLSQQKITT